MSDDTTRTVPLSWLRENDYNPRKDLGDVESLADSIEADGLISALTVRPVDDTDTTFEVIAGSRRLAALRSRFDDDHPVEVVVKDADDDTARRMALKENIEREDLTTMEEAWAFAREVEVDVDGERLNLAELHGNEVRQDELDSAPSIAKGNPDVQKVAEGIGKSPDYVAERIRFLTLPEGVHPLIDTSDLTKRAARMLARISIDDPDARERAIANLVDGLPESMSDDDYADLKDSIASAEQSWEQQKAIAEDAVEDYAQLVEERKNELAEAIEAAASELGGTVQLSGDVDQLLAEAEDAAESLSEGRSEVVSQRDAVSERRSQAEREATRAEQALAAHEGAGECPYCGSDATVDYLKERVQELRSQVGSAEDAMADLSERESNIRSLRTTVNTTSSALSDALDEYREAKLEAEQYAEAMSDD